MSSPEAQRNIAETATQAVIREAQVAYHGLMAAIAATRRENANQNVERMEHKIELYDAIGTLAMTGAEPETDIHPRTIAEKFVDWRMDRRARKKIDADSKVYRDSKTFGEDRSDFSKSVRQAVIDRVVSVPLRDRDAGDGVIRSVINNTKALFVGPDIKGMGSFAKKFELTKNNVAFLGGKKYAVERRKKSYEIKAAQHKLGGKTHRKTRRDKRRTDERLSHMVEMPITSRWRERRLRKAEERAERMEEKRLRHREAIRQLRENAVGNEQPTEVTDAEIVELANRSGVPQAEVERHINNFNNIEQAELEDTLTSHPEDMDQTLESLGFMISVGSREQRLAAVRNIVALHGSLDQASRINRVLIENFIANDLGYDNASGQSLEEYLTLAVDYGETDTDEEDED